jgi:Type II secretion system (T2SS), protein G
VTGRIVVAAALIGILLLIGTLPMAYGQQNEQDEMNKMMLDKDIKHDEILIRQYKRTITDLHLLGSAIADFIMDLEKVPQVDSIEELVNHDFGIGLTFAQFYLDETPEENVPLKDAWGNDFIYQAVGETFYLASPGSNKTFLGFDQLGCYLFSDKNIKGKDIIFSNKGFTFAPVTEINARQFLLLTIHIFCQVFNGFVVENFDQ